MNNRKDKFSSLMMEIPPSGIRKFFELCIGHDDIISLGVGEPDFPTPWVIREEAFYHLEKGHTSYTSNWGLIELREEIAKYLTRYNMDYDPKTEILPMKSSFVNLVMFHISHCRLFVRQRLFTLIQAKMDFIQPQNRLRQLVLQKQRLLCSVLQVILQAELFLLKNLKKLQKL